MKPNSLGLTFQEDASVGVNSGEFARWVYDHNVPILRNWAFYGQDVLVRNLIFTSILFILGILLVYFLYRRQKNRKKFSTF